MKVKDATQAISARGIVRELKKHVDLKYRAGAIHYFQERIKIYGIRLSVVRRISARYYKKVRHMPKNAIFHICEELLKTGYGEPKTIAFDWAYRQRDYYEQSDFSVFQSWLEKYTTNWGAVDDLCRHALGVYVLHYPEYIPSLRKWAGSSNRWLRRAAAVTLITSVRAGRHVDAALEIACRLMGDDDYLVQNGYGWLLKDASIKFPREVYNFVMKNKLKMPRRALRYAIERFPGEMKKRAMSK